MGCGGTKMLSEGTKSAVLSSTQRDAATSQRQEIAGPTEVTPLMESTVERASLKIDPGPKLGTHESRGGSANEDHQSVLKAGIDATNIVCASAVTVTEKSKLEDIRVGELLAEVARLQTELDDRAETISRLSRENDGMRVDSQLKTKMSARNSTVAQVAENAETTKALLDLEGWPAGAASSALEDKQAQISKVQDRIEKGLLWRNEVTLRTTYESFTQGFHKPQRADLLRALRDLNPDLDEDDLFEMERVTPLNSDAPISFDHFKALVNVPSKVELWVHSLPTSALLASAISGIIPTSKDLRPISELTVDQISSVCEGLIKGLEKMLAENVKLLQDSYKAMDNMVKKADIAVASNVQVVKMSCGMIDEYHAGIEGRTGSPDLKLLPTTLAQSLTSQIEMPYTIQQDGDLSDRIDKDKKGHVHPKASLEGFVSDGRDMEKARQVSDMMQADHDGLVLKHMFIDNISGPFTEEMDDMIVSWRLFRDIDEDCDGVISRSEIVSARAGLMDEHHQELVKALERAASKLKPEGDGLSFRDFSDVISTLPRVRGERVLWARSLGLDGELARLLEPGTVFDGLSGVLQMSEEQQRDVCDKFSRRLPILLREGLKKLRDRVSASGVKSVSQLEEANAKFSGTAGAFHGKFATLKEFYQGPEGLIGQPNPNLEVGMHREHCKRDSSRRFFVSSNYILRTTAEWEWFWVQNPHRAQLPEELQKRLNENCTYPGEVGDILKECNVQLTMLKANFEDAAQTLCAADLSAHMKNLVETSAQTALQLSVTENGTATAKENAAMIRFLVRSNHRISDAKRTEMLLEAFTRMGMKPDSSVAEICNFAPPDSPDWIFQIKIPKTEMAKSLQDKLASTLGGLFDKKQCLKGARIIPTQPAVDGKGLIVLVIAIPSSDLVCESNILQILSNLHLGEIRIAFNEMEYEYCKSVKEVTRQSNELVTEATRLKKQGRTRSGTFDEFFKSDRITVVQKKLVEKGLAKLIKEEVIALRLYTGPPFVLYNAVLRGFPISITDLLREENGEMNRFETTIFVICSGISKLARLTDVPPNRLLYRGLGGMLLPDEYWKESAEGFKGGVEYGLMSTTTKRSVAVEYSGIKHKRGILLEIQAGRIDIGASISFLSQYPGEEEYLMQPLSCMEAFPERFAQGEWCAVAEIWRLGFMFTRYDSNSRAEAGAESDFQKKQNY